MAPDITDWITALSAIFAVFAAIGIAIKQFSIQNRQIAIQEKQIDLQKQQTNIAKHQADISYKQNIITEAQGKFLETFQQDVTKSEIMRDLTNRAMEINKTFINGGIRSPYSQILKIPDDRICEFNAKAVALLQHINMLSVVYENRELLGVEVVRIYEVWARTILEPWISADGDLQQVWSLARDRGDMMSDTEKAWFNSLLSLKGSNKN